MALFTSRGQITKDTALDAVEELGLDRDAIAADAESDAVSAKVIQKSYDIAQILSLNGTPAYIIGDEVISGCRRLRLAQGAHCTTCGPAARRSCDG